MAAIEIKFLYCMYFLNRFKCYIVLYYTVNTFFCDSDMLIKNEKKKKLQKLKIRTCIKIAL